VTTDPRLLDVKRELDRVDGELTDALWNGRDADALLLEYNRLSALLEEGILYEPRF